MSSSILEDNQLIAQFMGGKLSKPKSLINSPYWKIPNSNNVVITHYDLYYHRLWEWIMPVVEKIESIKDTNECQRFYVSIVGESCIIRDSLKSLDVVSDNVCTSKIEAVFKSVVEFIKWYNQQSK